VFVRALSMDEGRKLQKITRTAKNPVRLRRAMVVMMSGQGQTVRDITSLLQVQGPSAFPGLSWTPRGSWPVNGSVNIARSGQQAGSTTG